MHLAQELINLSQAVKVSPGRPSTNCLWRWCRKGVIARSGQRVRLQHVRVGGKLFTSSTWLDEFGKQVAAADAEYFDYQFESAKASTVPVAPDDRRQADIARAAKSLSHTGLRSHE